MLPHTSSNSYTCVYTNTHVHTHAHRVPTHALTQVRLPGHRALSRVSKLPASLVYSSPRPAPSLFLPSITLFYTFIHFSVSWFVQRFRQNRREKVRVNGEGMGKPRG